jgi:hypothetical protein
MSFHLKSAIAVARQVSQIGHAAAMRHDQIEVAVAIDIRDQQTG